MLQNLSLDNEADDDNNKGKKIPEFGNDWIWYTIGLSIKDLSWFRYNIRYIGSFGLEPIVTYYNALKVWVCKWSFVREVWDLSLSNFDTLLQPWLPKALLLDEILSVKVSDGRVTTYTDKEFKLQITLIMECRILHLNLL